MSEKQKKLVIIDSNALLHRAWHAIPPLSTKDGLVVNAVYGFTMLLLKIIKELEPDYLVAAFDLAGKTFRHEEYTAYKAQRIKQADEFYQQIPITKEVLEAFNIPILTKEGFEADDVIGTIADHAYKKYKNIKTIIITGDLDALQLINERTEVFTLKRGFNDTITYDLALVKERYGLQPEQLIDLKALKGDASDNIMGVKGIGEKGAQDLIQEFGSLENLYQKIDKAEIKPRLKELLIQYKKEAFASKHLVTIVKNVPLSWDLEQAKISNFDPEEVYKIFTRLEFRTLLNKIPHQQADLSFTIKQEQKNGHQYHLIDNEKDLIDLITQLKKQKIISIDTETSGLDNDADVLGISLAWENEIAYFINLRQQKIKTLALKELQPILQNTEIKKIGHNIKYDYKVLKRLGLELEGIIFDTMLAGYLINPDHGLRLEEMAFSHLGYKKLKLLDLLDELPKNKKNISVETIPLERLYWYACEDADITWRLYNKLLPLIKSNKNFELLEKIEIPLIPVLANMEINGIMLDITFLKKMSVKFQQQIKKTQDKIYKLAGREFNISSPQQLKVILFEDLKISAQGIKKTKTGLSTAAAELDKMIDAHPIIKLIVEYRELTKLQSTYITALPELADKEKRVHTSFNQTVTATGRLSSSDPNLQNIPIRTELGREIRKAFVAPKNYVLLSADYSQIELRLAAAISKDPVMLKSFQEGEDIHARTAAEIHKIPLSAVTKEIRRTAKEVNFGVLYGLGSLGLAQRTGLNREEAKQFISQYFNIYKKIKDYIEETKDFAYQYGYAQTIFGRRRYLPEIHSSMPMLRASAERMAINMPLQGTAADLMKMAMIAIDAKLNKISPQAKLVLQVHDELVLEVPEKDEKKVARFIKETMESIYKMPVPLVVDVESGQNWGVLEKIKGL